MTPDAELWGGVFVFIGCGMCLYYNFFNELNAGMRFLELVSEPGGMIWGLLTARRGWKRKKQSPRTTQP
jgi:hypothetical protein